MSGAGTPVLPVPARRTRAGLRSSDPAAVLGALADPRRLAAAGLVELARVLERARAGAGEQPRRRLHALVVLAAARVLLARLAAALPGYVDDARAAGVGDEVLAAVVPAPASGPGALVERPPVRVRPPHHVPDERFAGLSLTDPAGWRLARWRDRLGALLEPLAGLPVSDYERRVLEHVAMSDTGEVAVVVAVLHRARAAAALPDAAGGAR